MGVDAGAERARNIVKYLRNGVGGVDCVLSDNLHGDHVHVHLI